MLYGVTYFNSEDLLNLKNKLLEKANLDPNISMQELLDAQVSYKIIDNTLTRKNCCIKCYTDLENANKFWKPIVDKYCHKVFDKIKWESLSEEQKKIKTMWINSKILGFRKSYHIEKVLHALNIPLFNDMHIVFFSEKRDLYKLLYENS